MLKRSILLIFVLIGFFSIIHSGSITFTDTIGTYNFSSGTFNNVRFGDSGVIKEELANNQDETARINMSGNVLLLHFNEDGSQGENGTFFNDSSGLDNVGTCDGGTTTCPTLTGGNLGAGAYSFDGSDDYIVLGPTTNLLRDVSQASISAWVNFPDIDNGNFKYIMDISRGTDSSSRVEFKLNGENKFLVGMRVLDADPSMQFATSSNPVAYESNTWYNLVAVIDYENDDVDLFVNGVEHSITSEPTFSATSTSDTSPQQVAIGIDAGLSGFQIEGSIDELAIWNRSLSADEVLEIYKSQADLYITNETDFNNFK